MTDLIIKHRSESDELKMFRSLNTRKELSKEDQIYYLNLEKGYKGELMFDEYLRGVSNNFLVLNDITFKYNHSTFQIDSLLIAQHKCYIFEVKNFEGDYIFQDGKFCSIRGKEIKDPMNQQNRTESLLRQLFDKLGINFYIESFLVFVNPEFYLYHAPIDQHIIFPNQINRLINKLNSIPSKLNENHHNLAEKLMGNRLLKSPYSQVPQYEYDQLRKGVLCVKCHALISDFDGNKIYCHKCGHKESFQSAVTRNVDELSLLFPDIKITSKLIMDWCGTNRHQITFKRILSKNFQAVGYGKGTYYI